MSDDDANKARTSQALAKLRSELYAAMAVLKGDARAELTALILEVAKALVK